MRAADELPPVERTPGGNDLSLLREMLALTPEQRIERNVEWLALVEASAPASRKAAVDPGRIFRLLAEHEEESR